jgi:hypothetical protein
MAEVRKNQILLSLKGNRGTGLRQRREEYETMRKHSVNDQRNSGNIASELTCSKNAQVNMEDFAKGR